MTPLRLPAVALPSASPGALPVPGRPGHASARGGRRAAEAGIAVLSVITVLVGLLMIAIPFVISQKLGRDRTESSAARSRAQLEVELVNRAVISWLRQGTAHAEQERKTRGMGGISADDTVDDVTEVTPPPSYRTVIAGFMSRSAGAPAPSLEDPRGSVWSWKVTDVNAQVNPNGASPYLIANLLGSGLLSSEASEGDTEIRVEHLCPDNPGSPLPFRREGGHIRIGSETIAYQRFEGGTFYGCSRGALKDGSPLLDNGPAAAHKKGAVVIDYAAWKMATHLVAARPGKLTSFDNLEDLKSIQRWGAGGVLEADRLEALVPYLTVWSRRETSETFLDGQLVVNALPSPGATGGEILKFADSVTIQGSSAYFNPGTLVRITDGMRVDYGMVALAGDATGGQFGTQVTLAGAMPEGHAYAGGRTKAEPLAPYPININTASREVLAAVFSQLQLRTVKDVADVVTPKTAWDLAGRVIESRQGPVTVEGEAADRKSGPFRHTRDFVKFVDTVFTKGALTARQAEALVRNAFNPHDHELAFGTAHFCFRTQDVYVVEGRAVIHNAGGEKVAESALRQVVEVGDDQATLWALDSQSDFESGLSLGTGGKYIETYPFNVGFVSDRDAQVQPRNRAAQALYRKIYPSDALTDETGQNLGDVRRQAARLKLTQATYEQHFDDQWFADGWSTEKSGSFTQPVKGMLLKGGEEDPWIHPFTVAMWMKPYSRGSWFAWDTGAENYRNRISLFVQDGDKGKELVLRVNDATLEERGAELYVPLDRLGYQPETWYHLQATVRGCDPTMMDLFVDGVSVGRPRGMTYLESTVGNDSTTLAVESTDGFVAPGALLVGDEVVEYDTLGGNAFTDCVRGARGTQPRGWAAGTPVKVLGYSHPILLELRKGGAGLETQRWTEWGFMKVAYTKDQCTLSQGTTTFTFDGMKEDEKGPVDVTLEVGTDPDTTRETSEFAKNNTDAASQANTFNTRGYALMVCTSVDTTGGTLSGATKIGGWEVVWYERKNTTLSITRYQSTAWHNDSGTPFFVATQVSLGGVPIADAVVCRIAPISFVGLTAGSGRFDYLDPGTDTKDREKLAARSPDGDPDDSGPDRYDRPRVIVGTDNPRGANECIAYDSIDQKKSAGSVIFVADNDALLTSLQDRLINPQYAPEFPPTSTPRNPPPGGSAPAPSSPPAPRTPPGGATLVGLEVDDEGVGGGTAEPVPGAGGPQASPDAPPTPGGSIAPGTGREPPVDDSGGGGTSPQPGGGPNGNQPPAGVRPPADPPPPEAPPPTTQDPNAPPRPPTIAELKALFPFRGVSDTIDRARGGTLAPSDDEAKILPCFRIVRKHETTGQPVGGPMAGYSDVVTLISDGAAKQKEQRRVRWSQGRAGGGRSTSWVALSDFIESTDPYKCDEPLEWRVDYRGRTRMMKFPSGEMPNEVGDNLAFARNEVGGGEVVTAFLDEIHVWRHQEWIPMALVANAEPLTEKTREITLRAIPPTTTLEGIDGYDKDVGVINLDGELIVYRGLRDEGSDMITLENCHRGALGTKARPHAAQAYARFVPDLWVSSVDGRLNRDAPSIPVKRTRLWPREGAARLVSDDQCEIVHYTTVADGALTMPENLDADPESRGRGLLRGRFGTEAVDHDDGTLVIWQPFRFWDRTLARRGSDRARSNGFHDHPAGAFVEFAKTVRDAVWRRVFWQYSPEGRIASSRGSDGKGERREADKRNVLVLVRFDQGVAWDSATNVVDMRGGRGTIPADAVTSPQKYLFLFDDPEGANKLDLEADTIEMRVYFPYLLGQYKPQDVTTGSDNPDDQVFENSWKSTPWLQQFGVEYVNRTRIRYSADVR